MRTNYKLLGITAIAWLIFGGSAMADGRVIITEIMYNPGSNEKRGEAEWIEIANVGDSPVEIVNWKLDDEDSQDWADWGSFSCTLPPGGVAVLVNQAAADEESFREAWDIIDATTVIEEVEENILPGRIDDMMANSQDPDPPQEEPPSEEPAEEDEPESDVSKSVEENSETASNEMYLVIPIEWGSLANGPDAENEILQLLNEHGEVICEVNYQAGGDWPTFYSPGSASLELIDANAVDLNDGKNWRAAEAGVDGARENKPNDVYDGNDVGSPGVVAGLNAPLTTPTKKDATANDADDKSDDQQEKPKKKDDNEVDY